LKNILTPRRRGAENGLLLPNCALPPFFFHFCSEKEQKKTLCLLIAYDSLRLCVRILGRIIFKLTSMVSSTIFGMEKIRKYADEHGDKRQFMVDAHGR
jgi:hypothetical protein